MSFMSMAHMYQTVRDMYDSPKWREKVLHMSDNQIMAIYFSREEREAARKSKTGKGLKHTLQKKIKEIRGKNCENCGGCVRDVGSGKSVASCTDDYIPEQLSFF